MFLLQLGIRRHFLLLSISMYIPLSLYVSLLMDETEEIIPFKIMNLSNKTGCRFDGMPANSLHTKSKLVITI